MTGPTTIGNGRDGGVRTIMPKPPVAVNSTSINTHHALQDTFHAFAAQHFPSGEGARSPIDGLFLLTASAGSNTGWANPGAFVRAVRSFHDGPVGQRLGPQAWLADVLARIADIPQHPLFFGTAALTATSSRTVQGVNALFTEH